MNKFIHLIGSAFTTLTVLLLLPATTLASTSAASGSPTSSQEANPGQYVDPFIGTTSGGNDFPGASAPFGMIQWSPDTTPNSPGGYDYSANTITGFSLTHLSGAGCPAMGDVPVMPVSGTVNQSPDSNPSSYQVNFQHQNESASPGYYQVALESGIGVQLAVTSRTGIGEFSQKGSQPLSILINAGGSANGNSSAEFSIANNEITGSVSSGGFCGASAPYTVYFVADFNQSISSDGTWNGNQLNSNQTAVNGSKSGLYVTFQNPQNGIVLMKTAISYVSVANAKANLQAEDPGWNFQQIKSQTAQTWNQMLSEISVSGGTLAEKQNFYTALYHSMLAPNLFSDVNGQYIGFDGKVHTAVNGAQYTNFSGWDIYRSEIQLLTILQPKRVSAMMQSLVRDAEQGGQLPKWPIANQYTGIMDGDSADPIISSAYAFGARSFDVTKALQFMMSGATTLGSTTSGYTERSSLGDYLKYGYVPDSQGGGAATTLEYTTDDFAVASLAKSLGDQANYAKFIARAQNWQNLFDPKSGYIVPRASDGAFESNFNPSSGTNFVEGTSAQYSWMVPYNLSGLFQLMGGDSVVNSRLDKFFQQLNSGTNNTPYAYMGNEPGLEVPWEYDFSNEPWMTQKTVREVLNQLYTPTPSGLDGNDDLGEMSSWYVWSSLGLYPEIPGVAGFTVGSPLFQQATLHLGNGGTLTILGNGASAASPYIQALSLNGTSVTGPWINGNQLLSGNSNTLQYNLSSKPDTSWGVSDNAGAGAPGLANSSTQAQWDPPSFQTGQESALPTAPTGPVVVAPGASAQIKFGLTSSAPVAEKFKWSVTSPLGDIQKSGVMSLKSGQSTYGTVDLQVSPTSPHGVSSLSMKFVPLGNYGMAPPHPLNVPVVVQDPGELTSFFNNTGISDDNNPGSAAFDGNSPSYSQQALDAVGLQPNATVSVDGLTFHWPDVQAGTPDNIMANGQTLPVHGSGKTLGFLGASAYGPSSGQGVITYTDGTTQEFTLSLSDWTLNCNSDKLLSGESIAAKTAYQNTTLNSAKRNGFATYVFYTSVTLNPQKTVASITLPAKSSITQGQLHVFAVSIG